MWESETSSAESGHGGTMERSCEEWYAEPARARWIARRCADLSCPSCDAGAARDPARWSALSPCARWLARNCTIQQHPPRHEGVRADRCDFGSAPPVGGTWAVASGEWTRELCPPSSPAPQQRLCLRGGPHLVPPDIWRGTPVKPQCCGAAWRACHIEAQSRRAPGPRRKPCRSQREHAARRAGPRRGLAAAGVLVQLPVEFPRARQGHRRVFQSCELQDGEDRADAHLCEGACPWGKQQPTKAHHCLPSGAQC